MLQYEIRMSELAEEDLENAGDHIAFALLNPIAADLKNTKYFIR